MDLDLHQVLHELGDGPEAGGIELELGSVLTRVHRRRVVHAATYGVVGAGLATALAVAGATLDPTPPDDATPAVPTPTSSPAPGPTSTSEPAPTTPPARVVGLDACGTTAGDGPHDALEADPVTTDSGARVSTVAHLDGSAAGAAGATVTDAAVVVLRDGVVVGVPAPEQPWAATTVPAQDVLDLSVAAPVLACPAPGAAAPGAPLPAGEYDLAVHVALTDAGGATRVLVSRAVPLSVVVPGGTAGGTPRGNQGDGTPGGGTAGDGTAPTSGTGAPSSMPAEVPGFGVPACGEPWPGRRASGAPVRLDATVSVVDGSLVAQVTSTSTAVDVVDGAATDAVLAVLRDGVVVARSSTAPVVPFALRDWRVGDSVERLVTTPAVTCGPLDGLPAGSALPAGTYEVWGVQGVWRAVDRSSGQNIQYGGPWTVTVD